MHTMNVFIQDGGWMVRDNNPSVVELFGTDVLPTPFLASTPVSMVINTIRSLNPDAVVSHG